MISLGNKYPRHRENHRDAENTEMAPSVHFQSAFSAIRPSSMFQAAHRGMLQRNRLLTSVLSQRFGLFLAKTKMIGGDNMAEQQVSKELLEFIKPIMERVDFRAPDLAAASCGCSCGCSGGGGGGGGGGSGRIASDLLRARGILPSESTQR